MISAFGVDHGDFSKSLVNGVFKPASALSHAERAGVGGYKRAKGISDADRAFRSESKGRHMYFAGKPAEQMHHSAAKTPAGMDAYGVTYRLGSAKHGKSYIEGAGINQRAMDQVMSHERQHAAPRRSEYRLHQQIIKDPVKTMREEARADIHSDVGHYTAQKKRAQRGEPISVYGAGAITKDPSHIQRAYPNMSSKEASRGIEAYRSVQNKIAGKKPGWSRKKKMVVGGTGIVGVTGLGGLEHHYRTRTKNG